MMSLIKNGENVIENCSAKLFFKTNFLKFVRSQCVCVYAAFISAPIHPFFCNWSSVCSDERSDKVDPNRLLSWHNRLSNAPHTHHHHNWSLGIRLTENISILTDIRLASIFRCSPAPFCQCLQHRLLLFSFSLVSAVQCSLTNIERLPAFHPNCLNHNLRPRFVISRKTWLNIDADFVSANLFSSAVRLNCKRTTKRSFAIVDSTRPCTQLRHFTNEK